jgi:hypothetical protein
MIQMRPQDYHFHYRYDEDVRPTADIHYVPVAFNGRILPGIMARIGRYGTSNVYVVAPDYNEYFDRTLNARATRYLRKIGMILPVETVGCPDCTPDLCTLTERYSDMDLGPRRLSLAAIPDAAADMKEKRIRWQNERTGLTEWSKKGLPQEIEYLLHQFVGPTPGWRSWIADAGQGQGAGYTLVTGTLGIPRDL